MKGVCYSFNLKEYFPDDLREALKNDKPTNFLEVMFQEEDINGVRSPQQFYPGPTVGLELVLNVEGK